MTRIEPSFIREILAVTSNPEVISFAGGLPNPQTFPLDQISAAAAEVLSAGVGQRTLQYTETPGDPQLRAWIAGRYQTRHGMVVDPDQVIVVNGSQQVLDLIGKVLLNEGAPVVVEEPTYLGALQGLSFLEPEWRSVPLATGGINLAAAAEALADSPPLMYVIPNFQNPTGSSYTDERRDSLASLIGNTLLVEDDPYGELRFHGPDPLPITARIPDRGVLMGSFSKTVAPGLRTGWMVVPPWLVDPVIRVKQAADLHSNHLSQRILARLLTNFDFDAHLASIRDRYQESLRAMESAVDEMLVGVERSRPEGGMFLWVTLPVGVTARQVLKEAMERDVVFVPGDCFSPSGGSERSMRLSFCTVDPDTIRDGVSRLADAVEAAST